MFPFDVTCLIPDMSEPMIDPIPPDPIEEIDDWELERLNEELWAEYASHHEEEWHWMLAQVIEEI